MSSGDEAGGGLQSSTSAVPPRERCRVYVGNLPEDISSDELVEGLGKYGQVKDADIKFGRTRNGTAYAFIEYVTPEAAERAVNEGDGSNLFGVTLKVEFTGIRKNKSRSYNGNEPSYVGSGPPQRSDYRVIVAGLPRHTSWQDLKDHMRGAGPVGYAHVDEDGVGIVEYTDRRGVEKALNRLHRSTIETHLRRSAKIEVYLPEDFPSYHYRGSNRGGRGGRSPSPSYRSSSRYEGGHQSSSRRGRGSMSRSPSPLPARGGGGSSRRDEGPDGGYRSASFHRRHLSPRRGSMSPPPRRSMGSSYSRRSASPSNGRRSPGGPPPMRRGSISDSRGNGRSRDESSMEPGVKRSRVAGMSAPDLEDSVKRRRRQSVNEDEDISDRRCGGVDEEDDERPSSSATSNNNGPHTAC